MRSEVRSMIEMLEKANPMRNPRVKSVGISLRNGGSFTTNDFQIERNLLMARMNEDTFVCTPLAEIVGVEITANLVKINHDKLPHTFAAITTGEKL